MGNPMQDLTGNTSGQSGGLSGIKTKEQAANRRPIIKRDPFVMATVKLHSKLSHRALGRVLGVSPQTAKRLRQELMGDE